MKKHKIQSAGSGSRWRALQLVAAAGDAAVLLGFAAIGRSSHREAEGGPIFGLLGAAAPFLFGWFLAAWLLGAYRAPAFSGQRRSALTVARAWLAGGVVALLIRSLVERHLVPPSFIAVALGFNLATLLAWRAVLVGLSRRLFPQPAP